ncbi:MAG: DUF4145 domain-containing protein [Kurthia gibsonii]
MEKYEHKIYCYCCKKETNHYCLSTVKRNQDDYLSAKELEEISAGRSSVKHFFERTYNISQCCGCDEVNFFETYYENFLNHDGGEDIYTFPPMPHYLKKGEEIHMRDFRLLPNDIVKIINEIRVSLYSDSPQPLLLTMGIRMILEAITLELGIVKGWNYEEIIKVEDGKEIKEYEPKLTKAGNKTQRSSLHHKLYKMYEMKYISKSQFEILNKIKSHGNAATHDLTAPDYSVILKMYSVTEDILYQQFELNRIGI